MFMTNGSLMKIKSIADAIIDLQNQFCLFESVRFRQVLLYKVVFIPTAL